MKIITGNSSDKYIIVPGCIEQIALKEVKTKEYMNQHINPFISQHTCLAIALLSNLL